MPIRFPTEAANADVLGEETPPVAGSADGEARARARAAPGRFSRTGSSIPAAGKPGKDINAAGFVKDKDPGPP